MVHIGRFIQGKRVDRQFGLVCKRRPVGVSVNDSYGDSNGVVFSIEFEVSHV